MSKPIPSGIRIPKCPEGKTLALIQTGFIAIDDKGVSESLIRFSNLRGAIEEYFGDDMPEEYKELIAVGDKFISGAKVEPVVEEPVTEDVVEPVVEEPVTEDVVEPVVDPVTEEPVVEQPLKRRGRKPAVKKD